MLLKMPEIRGGVNDVFDESVAPALVQYGRFNRIMLFLNGLRSCDDYVVAPDKNVEEGRHAVWNPRRSLERRNAQAMLRGLVHSLRFR